MNGKELSWQLNDLPDKMLAEAMASAKAPHRRQKIHRVVRIAALAVVVVILFLAVSLFPAGDNAAAPYFAVYVYASETDYVELSPGGATSAFSNITNDVESNNGNLPYLPNGGSIISPNDSPDQSVKPKFRLDIQFTQAPDVIEVTCNGEQVLYTEHGYVKLRNAAVISYSGYILPMPYERDPDYQVYGVYGIVEEESIFEVIFSDENGKVLQKTTLLVQPVDEGYTIILQDVYVA